MLFTLSVLGVVTLITGCLLLFSYPTFKQMSQMMNRPVFSEVWVHEHRSALGLLLIGLTGFLFVGVYFILKMGV